MVKFSEIGLLLSCIYCHDIYNYNHEHFVIREHGTENCIEVQIEQLKLAKCNQVI